jgi:hypothetical protein
LHIYEAYKVDLQTQEEFTLEVKRWKARWEIYSTDQVKPSHLCETLELVNKNLYPNIYCILKIYLAMPHSTATAERSFSVLKRVKTYLRTQQYDRKDDHSIDLGIATYSQTYSASTACSLRQV